MVGIEVKTTRKEALTQQGVLEEKIEANKRDFQARLEVVDRTEKGARRHMY
jgi:serine/threonine protein kinase HipA of HipAB toxin-antitoxin module